MDSLDKSCSGASSAVDTGGRRCSAGSEEEDPDGNVLAVTPTGTEGECGLRGIPWWELLSHLFPPDPPSIRPADNGPAPFRADFCVH